MGVYTSHIFSKLVSPGRNNTHNTANRIASGAQLSPERKPRTRVRYYGIIIVIICVIHNIYIYI